MLKQAQPKSSLLHQQFAPDGRARNGVRTQSGSRSSTTTRRNTALTVWTTCCSSRVMEVALPLDSNPLKISTAVLALHVSVKMESRSDSSWSTIAPFIRLRQVLLAQQLRDF